MQTSIRQEKLPWADALRAIATLSVILVHVSAELMYQFGEVPNQWWWIGNLYDSAARFCVPLFVMLTGALVLCKEYELTPFLKKIIFRIFIPFLFWNCIYIYFNLYLKHPGSNTRTAAETVKWVFDRLLHGGSNHLWYIYMIIGIYLFIPIIGKWCRTASERELRYFLIIWTVTLFLNVPYGSNFIPGFDLVYFGGYLGYLILGFYLSQHSAYNRSLIAFIFIIVGTVVTAIGTSFLSSKQGSLSEVFYNYLTPNILLLTMGVFLFFKNFTITNTQILKCVGFISRYSFGIYLCHMLVLFYLDKAGLNCLTIHPLIGIPLTTFICLLASVLLIYLIEKLPGGKHIT